MITTQESAQEQEQPFVQDVSKKYFVVGGKSVSYQDTEVIDTDKQTPHQIKKIISRLKVIDKFKLQCPANSKDPYVACEELSRGLMRLLNNEGHLYQISVDFKKFQLVIKNTAILERAEAPVEVTVTPTQRKRIQEVIVKRGRWIEPGPEWTYPRSWYKGDVKELWEYQDA